MASIDKFLPTLLKIEGGFSNHPLDKGGATNCGVTLATFQSYYGKRKTVDDLKNITAEQVRHIYKTGYWDPLRCDDIKNQGVANLLADFGVNSGTARAAKKLQELLGLQADGKVGPKTLAAINGREPSRLFADFKSARERYYYALVYANPTQRVFLTGWLNRLNIWKFQK